MQTRSLYLTCVVPWLILTGVMAGCGGGGQAAPTNGPTAILNGSSIATATTHWLSDSCLVNVELTADGGFTSLVAEGDVWVQTSGTWTASASSGANISDTDGSLVTNLTSIEGSTASKTFTAGVGINEGYQQDLGPCTFALESGGLLANP